MPYSGFAGGTGALRDPVNPRYEEREGFILFRAVWFIALTFLMIPYSRGMHNLRHYCKSRVYMV